MKKYAACLLIILLAFSVSSLAEKDSHFAVEQRVEGKTVTKEVNFFQGPVSAEEFYNYDGTASNTGLAREDTCLLIPYLSPEGRASLIIVLDKSNDGSAGKADMRITGLPESASLSVSNDSSDNDPGDQYEFSLPEAYASWKWSAYYDDGLVITGLGEEFSITVKPNFAVGIENWLLITGSPGNTSTLALDPKNSITLQRAFADRPMARFELPQDPAVGQKALFDAGESKDPDGKIVEYQWDFDEDGNFEVATEDPEVAHRFQKGGEQEVGLRVVDSQGMKNAKRKRISVHKVLASIKRDISARNLTPGDTVKVTLKLNTETDLNGAGVVEKVPAGWKVEPVQTDGAKFKSSGSGTYEWLFMDNFLAGETREIVYLLKVPDLKNLSMDLSSDVSLSGAVEVTRPSYSAETEGESRLNVLEALPLSGAIAHYDTERGTLDMKTDQTISSTQLKWAAELWLEDNPVPGTGGERITYDKLRRLAHYKLEGVPVTDEIKSAEIPKGSFHREIRTRLPENRVILSYKPEGGSTYEGNHFIVRVVLNPSDRSLEGVGIQESIPSNWEVKPINTDKAVFKEEARRWVFLERVPKGGSVSVSYKVTVPEDARIDSRKILGRMNESLSGASLELTGEGKIETVETLDVKTAISRWDTGKGSINLGLGDTITYNQVKKAIYFWLEDEVVPYTGGKKISFDRIKQIVAYWQLNKPVGEPLS